MRPTIAIPTLFVPGDPLLDRSIAQEETLATIEAFLGDGIR
jgi:hypothetical protein